MSYVKCGRVIPRILTKEITLNKVLILQQRNNMNLEQKLYRMSRCDVKNNIAKYYYCTFLPIVLVCCHIHFKTQSNTTTDYTVNFILRFLL